MEWITVLQIALLMILAMLLGVMAHATAIDKRREDAIKRKDAGV